ncbi:AMP-binding protein [Paeniglutamicibacter psychrophenolicus]|uniref:Acyl-CoA synthetase (AMP-forming)/AMP-acid ligase II n=1 Tax=Paeniglutamicibacter psychrophenolicus TaxID=257454 RepID=A0ABS4WHB0_9MICC|nr:AMP-binding protein [Paeniglutamicibacter psychrophenolicus]MBP2375600.1 acyl-CoA synthetase (AMP-forming)/AMP-acid ligase II [Paeniglutamicibacter psychrophenolicus]
MAVIDFFDRGWSLNPGGTAYCTDTETWTFDEAGEMSCRIANGLRASGVGRETNVAVLSPNAPLAWICVLGIWRSGAAWVPLNPSLPEPETAKLLDRFDIEVLFYHPSLSGQIEYFRAGLGDRMTFVALGEGTDDSPLAEWVADQPPSKPEILYPMDDVVMVAPTSGTTGAPKGVMNTNRSIQTMVVHQMLALEYPGEARIVNLAAAPMTHTSGMLSLQSTARGGTVVVVPRATPDHILPAIERHGVTELFLPPTVIYRLLEVLENQPRDTSSLCYLLYAAAPMSVDKLRQGIAMLGPVFIECYGQMEAPAAITFLRPHEHFIDGQVAPADRLASCGRPFPLVSVAIKDPASGKDLGVGETGEICVRGDLLMKGYYKEPEKTAETIIDGWLHTGDLGRLDAEGFVYVTDRKKDMIISGGFNVYPLEVEQVLWSHPAVEDCAVVGAPDDDWGERVVAVVQFKPGWEADPEDLRQLCRDQLGPIRAPKNVVVVDRLPRSANGKVLKKEVRERFWEHAGRAI